MNDMSNQPLLTVAIVADGDSPALAQTLACAEAIADELIVVDTQQTDDTFQVAGAHGAKVLSHVWNDDFSQARNHALEHARGAWVLWLEPGETLSASDAGALRPLLQHDADSSTAYEPIIRIPPAPGGLAGEQTSQVRLAPNRPEIRFAGRVRESLAAALAQAGIDAQRLAQYIDKSAAEIGEEQKRTRAELHIRLGELAIGEQGPSADLLNCLAEAKQILGDSEASDRLYRQALELSSRGSQEMLEAYYGLLTSLEGQQGGPEAQLSQCNEAQLSPCHEAQLSLCVEALAVFPGDIQLLCAMGGYLQTQGRTELAAQTFHTAWLQGQVHPGVWHLQDVREAAAVCYARLVEEAGDQQGAVEFLQEAMESQPRSALLGRHLLNLHLRLGRFDAALSVLDKIPAESSAELRPTVIGACLARRECWASAIAYLNRAFTENCRDPLCLRWLAVALLATERSEQAAVVLEEWLRIEPENAEARSMLSNLTAAASASGDSRRIDADHELGGPASGQSQALRLRAST